MGFVRLATFWEPVRERSEARCPAGATSLAADRPGDPDRCRRHRVLGLHPTAKPTWTATTALTTQSQNRAPEQDAVLSIGYVDYFN
jgi:hypothetical protein